jgi:cytochrome c biogenesis protein CcdA
MGTVFFNIFLVISITLFVGFITSIFEDGLREISGFVFILFGITFGLTFVFPKESIEKPLEKYQTVFFSDRAAVMAENGLQRTFYDYYDVTNLKENKVIPIVEETYNHYGFGIGDAIILKPLTKDQ